MQQEQTKSIFVAIVGRPNVGKSSLLNRMVGEKVAIVTAKPQTTRTRITGILTRGAVQYVFLDTPGIHRPRTRLGERMAKATADSVAEVDAVVMLFEPYGELTEAEQALVEDIRVKKVPALAAVNKTDTLKKETDLASAHAVSGRAGRVPGRAAAVRVRGQGLYGTAGRTAAFRGGKPSLFPGRRLHRHAGKGSRGGGAAGKDAAEPAGRDSPMARL